MIAAIYARIPVATLFSLLALVGLGRVRVDVVGETREVGEQRHRAQEMRERGSREQATRLFRTAKGGGECTTPIQQCRGGSDVSPFR